MSTVCGRPVSLGGGATKWNVYTGLTAPKLCENGIWAKIDVPVKQVEIIFDYVRPLVPVENTLFIRYFSNGYYPTIKPFIGFEGATYQVASVQFFALGKWQNLDAYRGNHGQWVKFSQGEYFYYTFADGAVKKFDRNGQTLWSTSIPTYKVYEIEVDYINRYLFLLVDQGTTTKTQNVAICKVNIDTGSIIKTGNFLPFQETSGSIGYTDIIITPVKDNFLLQINVSSRMKLYTVSKDSLEISYAEGFNGYGSTRLICLEGGSLYANRNSSTTESVKRIVSGTDATVDVSFPVSSDWAPTEGFWDIRADGATFVSYFRYGYYHYGVNIVHGTSVAVEGTINYANGDNGGGPLDAKFLPNGELAVGTYSNGVRIMKVAASGAPSSPYKTLLAGSPVGKIVVGAEGFLAVSGRTAHLIGYDDKAISTAICDSSLCTIEPGSFTTFPKLYPNNV